MIGHKDKHFAVVELVETVGCSLEICRLDGMLQQRMVNDWKEKPKY
jgi:hypothetical protein